MRGGRSRSDESGPPPERQTTACEARAVSEPGDPPPFGLLWAAAVFAVVVGLAGASFLVLLAGISDFLSGLGVPLWQARMLPGAIGLATASLVYQEAVHRFADGGLTPSQAMSQLRHEIDLAALATAGRQPPNPATSDDGQASG